MSRFVHIPSITFWVNIGNTVRMWALKNALWNNCDDSSHGWFVFEGGKTEET